MLLDNRPFQNLNTFDDQRYVKKTIKTNLGLLRALCGCVSYFSDRQLGLSIYIPQRLQPLFISREPCMHPQRLDWYY